jgi:hypothetical protein
VKEKSFPIHCRPQNPTEIIRVAGTPMQAGHAVTFLPDLAKFVKKGEISAGIDISKKMEVL